MFIRTAAAGFVAVVAAAVLAAPASAYTVTMTPMDLRVQAGQLSDGEPAVIEVFNAASQASAHKVIDAVRAEAPTDVTWDFESTTHVTFPSFAIAQVISGTWSATRRAQVINYVGTVVVDSRSGRTIDVVDLFSDRQAGLNRLAEQTRILTGYDGLAATPENFANWIPTADGVELHFPSSLLFWPPAITVPWSELTDVIAPNMAGLAHA